jgi:hypothetical protein
MPNDSGRASWRDTLAYVAPFAVFMLFLALRQALSLDPAVEYPLRTAAVVVAILVFSKQGVRLAPARPLGSVLIGIAIFLSWIGPDLLFPGYRSHWLFQNGITGSAASSLPEDLQRSPAFLAVRVAGSVAVVPVIEELFWRGWLMRCLISPDFLRVPLGAFTPLAFWATAVLFGAEHGPYWDVGILAGIGYNWWILRTRSLADCILAHAVTNACLAGYVLHAGRWEYWL